MITTILKFLAGHPEFHKPNTKEYNFLKNLLSVFIKQKFGPSTPQKLKFDKNKTLFFPFKSMGVISTLHLFGLDELIIFSYYYMHKKVYKKTADIGANLGLHSAIMCLCGYKVSAYEPDEKHFNILKNTIKTNNLKNIKLNKCAVSDTNGIFNFVRVEQNTTASHLMGAKNSYGKRKVYTVKTVKIQEFFKKSDLVKIDAEGHEPVLIKSLNKSDWKKTDAIIEIGSSKNRKEIFNYCKKSKLNIFSQKRCWKKAKRLCDIPASHHEGSAFISLKKTMPW